MFLVFSWFNRICCKQPYSQLSKASLAFPSVREFSAKYCTSFQVIRTAPLTQWVTSMDISPKGHLIAFATEGTNCTISILLLPSQLS